MNLADPLGLVQLVNHLQKRPRVHAALTTNRVLAVVFGHLVENPVNEKKTCRIPVRNMLREISMSKARKHTR